MFREDVNQMTTRMGSFQAKKNASEEALIKH